MNNEWPWWGWALWFVGVLVQANLIRLEIPNILYRRGRKLYGHTAMHTAIEMHGDSYSIRASWNALKSLKECQHAHFYGDECELCFFLNNEKDYLNAN